MFDLSIKHTFLSILLLANTAFASRYSFSIKEIIVRQVADITEDDLVLAIATTGSSANNKTWVLGPVHNDDKIQWTNLTQEIQTDSSDKDLSVGFGLVNRADADDNKAFEVLQGVVSIAAAVPGPQAPASRILDLAMGVLSNFLDCDGPAALGNAVYSATDLANLNKDEEKCETRDYSYEAPGDLLSCGSDNTTYSVTHCLKRLDDKASSATIVLPGAFIYAVSLAVVLLCGGYNSFV